MAKPKAPFLPYARLSRLGEAFLEEHHPEDTLPIPVEDIVDQKLKIDIVPMRLSPHEIESFTSHDMSTFYVDVDVYNSDNTNRYRYSLAHELSHVILHKNIFENAGFKDIAGWKEFTLSFGEDYKWIEWQAYSLAGILLVPTKHLLNKFTAISKKLEDGGIDIRTLGPNEMNQIAKILGRDFGVSSAVIHKRAVREGLWAQEDVLR